MSYSNSASLRFGIQTLAINSVGRQGKGKREGRGISMGIGKGLTRKLKATEKLKRQNIKYRRERNSLEFPWLPAPNS